MFDNGNVQQDKLREELTTLKEEAIASLERRGYEVRGKTPAQIRRALKRRPKKGNQPQASNDAIVMSALPPKADIRQRKRNVS
jgi:hypothetical protein